MFHFWKVPSGILIQPIELNSDNYPTWQQINPHKNDTIKMYWSSSKSSSNSAKMLQDFVLKISYSLSQNVWLAFFCEEKIDLPMRHLSATLMTWLATHHLVDLDSFPFLFSIKVLLDIWKLRFWIKYIFRRIWLFSACVSSNTSSEK